MNWNDLTMAQKNELMQTYIRNGVTSLEDMRSHFNSFATGGPKRRIKTPEEILAEKGLPQQSVDNVQYQQPIIAYDDKKAYEEELERQRLQKIEEERIRRTPILKADTTTEEERRRYRNKAEYDQAISRMNETAANFGRAIGANYDMTPEEAANWTLNTAQTLGYTAAPVLTAAAASGYYAFTNRPEEAAITAAMAIAPELIKGGKQLFFPKKNVTIKNPGTNTVASVENNYKDYIDPSIFRKILSKEKITTPPSNEYNTTKNILNNFSPYLDNSRFQIPRMADLIDYDLSKMSINDVEQLFGPEGRHLKEVWDVAYRTNNTEAMLYIENELKDLFRVPNNDPDIVKGLEEARSIYSIPEYRSRFDKFGTLGDTYIEDALYRLDNVQLQGREDVTGQFGLKGAASATVFPQGSGGKPIISLTQKTSTNSRNLTDHIRHEGNHIGHGTKVAEPAFIKVHNEKIRPVPRRQSKSNMDKYYEDMDEIVARSKTAVEYANSMRKPGESLDNALERLADIADADIYNQEIPADIRQMMSHFTKDSVLKFWKNFVGGMAPISLGVATISSESE